MYHIYMISLHLEEVYTHIQVMAQIDHSLRHFLRLSISSEWDAI